MYRILLVDDEPNILSALRRCLASIDVGELDGEALKVEAFTSPEQALERSEEQDFDLVVSDYRMPGMDGVEFLSAMMELQPAVPRMICSGYADRDAIIAAVNEVQLARFIGKPWVDEELAAAVVALLRPGSARARAPKALRAQAASARITRVEQDDDGAIVLRSDDPA
ncbi:CheY-like chemotaxis protein [Dokdonella fugitiva]|uniref:CheY-like chemotaxis protein n=1 Tax=Dokdonella fugitiva TaxID=328517 RepID=A0A839FCQ9_9GAMM|nr:response regulator [Dokdonella fugitiva]MBA8889854.1 CheY-like chemotaxis protein [Dokdonella fugitiva]